MKAVQWRYYIINQILLGNRLSSIPVEGKEYLEGLSEEVLQKKFKDAQVFKVSEVCQVFLNYLRLPWYPSCMSSTGRVVSVHDMPTMIRQKGSKLTVENCKGWASASIVDVDYRGFEHPEIRDNVLILPLEYAEGYYNIEEEMFQAFEYYCWGCLGATEKQKQAVRDVFSLLDLEENTVLDKGSITKLVDSLAEAKILPSTLSRTVLSIPDLSKTVPELGIPVWWGGNGKHTSVTAILPRGTSERGTRYAAAVLPIDVLRMYMEDGTELKQLYVKGTSIMLNQV